MELDEPLMADIDVPEEGVDLDDDTESSFSLPPQLANTLDKLIRGNIQGVDIYFNPAYGNVVTEVYLQNHACTFHSLDIFYFHIQK